MPVPEPELALALVPGLAPGLELVLVPVPVPVPVLVLLEHMQPVPSQLPTLAIVIQTMLFASLLYLPFTNYKFYQTVFSLRNI